MNIPAVFEAVKPDYLSPKVRAPYALHRFDSTVSGHADRFYFKFPPKGKPKSYISVTSLINNTLPKGYGFYRWVAQMGDQAEQVRGERAVFGSALHGEAFGPIIRGGGYDFDWLKGRDVYIASSGDGARKETTARWTNFQKLFPVEYREQAPAWYYAFTRSLMSFFQFAKERLVEVIAVEIPLASDKWGYAGTLDLVCLIKWNKKVRLAIIDMKSFFFTLFSEKESKVLYDSHALQLELQLELWRESFVPKRGPKAGVAYESEEHGVFYAKDIVLFNWSPKNWRGVGKNGEKIPPSYDLTEQTDNKFCRSIKVETRSIPGWQLFLYQSKLQDLPKPPGSVVDVGGEFDHWSNFNYENHITEVEL